MLHDENPTVAVLLSSNLERLGSGLDLDEVQTRLQDGNPSVHVRIVPGLPQQFGDLARIVAQIGASQLVLGVGTSAYSKASFQLQVRKAGLDPLGIEVVNLGVVTGQMHSQDAATEHAILILNAAIAKMRAFSGSRPENLKPVVPKHMSRRSLFSLPVLEYSATPSVYPSRCRAAAGCQQCVQACPHSALRITDGQIHLTKSRCTSCGICMSTCPNDAIDLPGVSATQMSAQITSLLTPDSLAERPRGILFLCADSIRAIERLNERRKFSAASNWLPVAVPCVEMLQPHWLLAPFTYGASGVAVLPCSDGCLSGKSHNIEDRVAYSQEVLRLLGEATERIMMLPMEDEQLVAALGHFQLDARPVHALPIPNPLAFGERSSVLMQLARTYNATPDYELEVPHSPFGVIEATDGCTLCGRCVTACPSQALLLEETASGSSLTFDSARCIACSDCLAICPEDQVLSLRRTTDIQRLAEGRITLREDTYQRCEACGKPIASEAMSRRVVAMLGDEFASTASIITRYCVDCRGFLS